MQAIDVVFVCFIALMVIHGFVKGFIEELFSWAALVLSIWVAVLLFPAGGAFIRANFMQNVRIVPEVLAFIAIFLIIMMVIKLLERILKDVVSGANLGFLNKILGAVFGVLEGFAFIALILFVLAVQPLFDPSKLIGESIFAQLLFPIIKFPINRGQDVVNTVLFMLPRIHVPFLSA